jgi:hypothetical protein
LIVSNYPCIVSISYQRRTVDLQSTSHKPNLCAKSSSEIECGLYIHLATVVVHSKLLNRQSAGVPVKCRREVTGVVNETQLDLTSFIHRMSRTAPFPTNGYTPTRVRSPAPMTSANGAGASDSVRPLQISRPSRPSSPGSQSNAGSSRGGPARPNRSDLRSRQPSEYSTSDVGTSRNSDYNQERSDGTARRQPDSRGGRTTNGASAGRTRERADTTDSQLSPAETNAASAALSAFKMAGIRKQSYDPEYEREKEQIQKEQRETQRRIKEKVPGRRRVRPGDIDGMANLSVEPRLRAHLCHSCS